MTLLKDKICASGYHFLFSCLLMLVAGYVVYFIWYVSPFYQLYAVENVFILLLLVDLVLGPLCTFIVFNRQKKELKRDLAIIIAIQLLAMLGGMWSIAQSRPAWLVLQTDTLRAVSPSMLVDAQDKPVSMPLWLQNWGKPKPLMLNDAAISQSEHVPLFVQPAHFKDYDAEQALDVMLPLSKIKDYNAGFYQQMMQQYPQAKGYFPVVTEASVDIAVAVLDERGVVVAIWLVPKSS